MYTLESGGWGHNTEEPFTETLKLPPGTSDFATAGAIEEMKLERPADYTAYIEKNGPYALYVVTHHEPKDDPNWEWEKGIFDTAQAYVKGDYTPSGPTLRATDQSHQSWNNEEYQGHGPSVVFWEDRGHTIINNEFGGAGIAGDILDIKNGLGEIFEGLAANDPGGVAAGLAHAAVGAGSVGTGGLVDLVSSVQIEDVPSDRPNWNVTVAGGQVSGG